MLHDDLILFSNLSATICLTISRFVSADHVDAGCYLAAAVACSLAHFVLWYTDFNHVTVLWLLQNFCILCIINWGGPSTKMHLKTYSSETHGHLSVLNQAHLQISMAIWSTVGHSRQPRYAFLRWYHLYCTSWKIVHNLTVVSTSFVVLWCDDFDFNENRA